MSLVGIWSKEENDVSEQLISMLRAISHPTHNGTGSSINLVINETAQTYHTLEEIDTPDGLTGSRALGQISATGDQRPYFDCSGDLILVYDGQFYDTDEVKNKLAGEHHLCNKAPEEVVTHLLEEHYQGSPQSSGSHEGSLEEALKATLELLDGNYSIAVTDGREVILLRDPVGTKPLYYAIDSERIAFASEKKALWQAGFTDVKPLRAGTLAIISREGLVIHKTSSLGERAVSATINDLSEAIDAYGKLIYSSVRRRLRDTDRVGVLLSGGVDSSLLARITQEVAAEAGIEVIAYSAGLPNSSDLEYAEAFTRSINLRHKINRLDPGKIDTYLPEVIQAIEERDFIQIEAGIGIYAALEAAQRDGVEVIFSGQGPDELWAGYSWYAGVIEREGYEGLLEKEWNDLTRADIETLDRENKIAMSLGMEERFPYLDLEIIKLAMSVSPELKVYSGEDSLGKHPHRELAKRLGIMPKFAERTKSAAQHGTGIHPVLDDIARRNGFTPELVEGIGYAPEKITAEKLGSSARYGYRYTADKSQWLIAAHIQFFFDVLAYKCGVLNGIERKKIEEFIDKVPTGIV